MAKVTIDGHEHVIEEMNFIALEMAWPFMEQALATVHPIAGTNASLAVIAAGLMESEGFDCTKFGIEATGKDDKGVEWPRAPVLIHIDLTNTLRKKLKAHEVGAVKLCLFEMIEEAGVELGPLGEPHPVMGEVSPSPEIVTDTSQSSLPLVSREVAGTA